MVQANSDRHGTDHPSVNSSMDISLFYNQPLFFKEIYQLNETHLGLFSEKLSEKLGKIFNLTSILEK
jgi:hypothetical protein